MGSEHGNAVTGKNTSSSKTERYKSTWFRKCGEEKGPTVCAFKTTKDYVFGGYNSKFWGYDRGNHACTDCFLYIINDRNYEYKRLNPTSYPTKSSSKYDLKYTDYAPHWGKLDLVIAQDGKKGTAETGLSYLFTEESMKHYTKYSFADRTGGNQGPRQYDLKDWECWFVADKPKPTPAPTTGAPTTAAPTAKNPSGILDDGSQWAWIQSQLSCTLDEKPCYSLERDGRVTKTVRTDHENCAFERGFISLFHIPRSSYQNAKKDWHKWGPWISSKYNYDNIPEDGFTVGGYTSIVWSDESQGYVKCPNC